MNQLQSKVFEIFLVVKNICDKYHLRYYAIGGTCLGAVRHSGFVPWDDDIDIAMPDKDYEIFMKIAPRELPKPLELLSIGDRPGSSLFFSKVHDTSTTMIEKISQVDSYKGVFIDIMPFCGLPDKEWKRDIFSKKLSLYLQICKRSKVIIRDSRWKGKIVNSFVKLIILCAPKGYFFRQWYKMIFKHKFDDSKYTGFVWSVHIKKRTFLTAWFDDYVELPFETTTVRCPKDWDSYLTKHYGNYMQLPPETKRTSLHSGGLIDLEKSYTYYQENGVNKS